MKKTDEEILIELTWSKVMNQPKKPFGFIFPKIMLERLHKKYGEKNMGTVVILDKKIDHAIDIILNSFPIFYDEKLKDQTIITAYSKKEVIRHFNPK